MTTLTAFLPVIVMLGAAAWLSVLVVCRLEDAAELRDDLARQRKLCKGWEAECDRLRNVDIENKRLRGVLVILSGVSAAEEEKKP